MYFKATIYFHCIFVCVSFPRHDLDTEYDVINTFFLSHTSYQGLN